MANIAAPALRRALSNLLLAVAAAVLILPVWFALVASSYNGADFLAGHVGLWFGKHGLATYQAVITGHGIVAMALPNIGRALVTSTIMALLITIGKIAISLPSAFAVTYFRFPLRGFWFALIFVTLLLPIEVRIVPTFQVAANFHMLNSFTGLTLPLIASATATFLFRQTFLSIPEELTEAARLDGASPMRFFIDIIIPMSRTSIAALTVILFIYGWNQYLWPLLVTTKTSWSTIVMVIGRLSQTAAEGDPVWNYTMATALLALVPPVFVVVAMQRLFVRGLTEMEK
ncbi:MAG: sn-glycerol-3-phosphate ABC transporter permease UgpE [Hyphomicrobiales bacterium]|nr:sn-glycerol-3-phosphate ABC transporter permease UgpE [Hyphomicrobiales bacterium]